METLPGLLPMEDDKLHQRSPYTGTDDDIYDLFGKKSKKMVGMCVPHSQSVRCG